MQRAVILVTLLGCSGGTGSGGGGCSGGGGKNDVIFEEVNNYTFDGSIALQTIEVQPSVNAVVDWSGVTTDFRGRPFSGAPDQVALLGCNFSQTVIVEELDNNTLAQEDCSEPQLHNPEADDDAASWSDFSIAGNPFEYKEDAVAHDLADKNWLLSILNTPAGRDEALMTVFVHFTETSTNDLIMLDDSSSVFSFEVDLESAPAISARLDKADLVMDWSSVSTDVFGNEFESLLGDELLIARFDGTIADVEEVFLQLDTEAAELYRFDVRGIDSASLDQATNEEGAAFSGFTNEGVWLLGVGCTSCLNPAPLLLAVVDPS